VNAPATASPWRIHDQVCACPLCSPRRRPIADRALRAITWTASAAFCLWFWAFPARWALYAMLHCAAQLLHH
jgi:hypothetical protein